MVSVRFIQATARIKVGDVRKVPYKIARNLVAKGMAEMSDGLTKVNTDKVTLAKRVEPKPAAPKAKAKAKRRTRSKAKAKK